MDKYLKKEVGHKLFTITVIDQSLKYVERIYTNNKNVYPLLGQKPIPKNIWSTKVLKKKNHFLCKNKNQIKKIYFDYDKIFSLNCGSIINLLILFKNKPIGTINILHNENHYSKNDINKIDHITTFYGTLLFDSSIKNEKSNKMIEKITSILNNDSNQLDAVALVPGSNFQYLTGGKFFLMERPLILIISKTHKPIAILPVLEVSNFVNFKI